MPRVLRFAWLAAFLLLVLSPCREGPAQDLRYLRHQSWSTGEGLPQDSVSQIAQTADGFLWIATEGGLARFDGASFRVFGHGNERAFVSDDVCCLAAKKEGLWIGTADGLILMGTGGFQRFTDRDGLPSAAIRELRAGPDGSLAVLTASGSATWTEGHFARAVAAEPDGEAEDAAAVDLPARSSSAEPVSSWSFSNTTVSVRHGSYARQWRAGVELPGRRVETLFVDRAGTAWIGTNSGLAVLTEHADKGTPVAALDGNVVLGVFQDREGNYWIGTETSGLHLLRPVKFRTEARLADQALGAVVQSGAASIWVGTRRDGLRLWRNGAVTAPAAPEALTSTFILSLAPGAEGSVWAGTPDGLNHVTPAGSVQRISSANGLPDDYIQALASDGRSGVWIGTRRGLVHLDGARTEVFTRAAGLGSDLIGALLLARSGDLWIGTSRGISRRAADGRFTSYGAESGLADGIVTGMAEDAEGGIWVATGPGNLSRFVHGAFRSYGGLTGPVPIDGLAADEGGSLWLRSTKGIDRIGLSDLERCTTTGDSCAARMRHYGLADGLPSVETVPGGSPMLWRMNSGELWFATRRGVAITDSAHLAANSLGPPVVIERFLADDASLKVPPAAGAAPLDIPFGYLRFTLEYAGLSYTAPSEVRYSYKLEGLDGEWTEAGTRRSATYTNLPPGAYRFRVRAMNNDGVWNKAGAELAFRIVPPFYRRGWFIGLLGLLGVLLASALVAGLYRLRLRRVQSRFQAVLGERNRMAREIHDTLAQDFVGVSLQLDIISQLLSVRKLDAAAEQVQQTRRLVTEGLAEARQSIWELRANLAEGSLPTRLAKVVERYAGERLRIHVTIGGAYRQLESKLEAEVLRVAQEALSNVQRHSGATEADVDLHYGGDMLILTVADRGKGFLLGAAPEQTLQVTGHYGLHGMQERAASVGGTLTIDTGLRSGAKVTLTAPIASADRVKRP